MTSIYTERFFASSDNLLPPSWTVPSDGFTYVLRDVWWSAPAIDLSEESVILSIAGVKVWGQNPTEVGPGYGFWFWQGRQALEGGDEVSLSLFGEITSLIDWIGTGYRLSPT